jgi:hypothetical protein
MTHCVTGLIAKPGPLGAFARKHALHIPLALAYGLEILPLRDEDIDSFLTQPMTGLSEGFNYLSEQLVQILMAASSDSSIMYFETDYFGGMGTQGAALFKNGVMIYGPASAEHGPINNALAMLGIITISPAADAFDTIGLGLHRHTDDWLELS